MAETDFSWLDMDIANMWGGVTGSLCDGFPGPE